MAKTRSKSAKEKPAPEPKNPRATKKRRTEGPPPPPAEEQVPNNTSSKEENPVEPPVVVAAPDITVPQVVLTQPAPDPMEEDEDQPLGQNDEPRSSDLYLDTVRAIVV
jgi:hypothetical protein